MSVVVRRAGRFVDADGRTITWAVADGRRGRRWRWAIAEAGGRVVGVHTLETDPDGAFSRLESAGPGRLLTLHRETDDGRRWHLHGNRVAATGVEHLAFAAPAPSLVLVGTDRLGLAAFAAGIPPLAGPAEFELLLVADDLATSVEVARVVPDARRALRLELGGTIRLVDVGADGLPSVAAGSTSWPLEEG